MGVGSLERVRGSRANVCFGVWLRNWRSNVCGMELIREEVWRLVMDGLDFRGMGLRVGEIWLVLYEVGLYYLLGGLKDLIGIESLRGFYGGLGIRGIVLRRVFV